jgi:hypothetical protein
VTAAAGAACLAAAVGAGVTVSPLAAAVLVALVFLGAVFVCFDVLGVATAITAAVPWLIVTSDLLPRLTLTFVAGAAAAAIFFVAKPQSDGSHASLLLRIGVVLFLLPIAISLGREGSGEGAIQAAKYVVFPIMAFVVAEGRSSRELVTLRTVVFWSSVCAIAVNLVVGLTGIANLTYYSSGDILGTGSEHALALLAGCVTAAALASSISLAWSPVIAVGAIATVGSGVRATLPGLALAALARMTSAGVRLRVIALVSLAVVATFISGAAGVVEGRIRHGQSTGEFSSFSAFGSGRGSIYEVAIRAWAHGSAFVWVFGYGLRTILGITQRALGTPFVGHSDIVDVVVQLGVVCLVGLVMIWVILFARSQSRLPLLVLASFALFNGILEYNGPVVIGMLLATSPHVTDRVRRTAPAMKRRTFGGLATSGPSRA